MKKLSLFIIAVFYQLIRVFAQVDSSAYKERKLKIDEINFLSGYYLQDGNNSAVTGGVGPERLTDFANVLNLKLLKTDKKQRLHSLLFEIGIDHYTSASSDNIDPSTISSASFSDTRFYPSVAYNMVNVEKGVIAGGSLSFSTEFDYISYGIGANIARISKDKNREASLKLQTYFDTWNVIYPVELRPGNGQQFSGRSNNPSPRNSYSLSFSLAQVINRRLQMAFLVDGIYQAGLLGTKYQRVYFDNNTVRVENLPDERFKLPIGLRANYFLDDRFIIRAFYRYYVDDWGISANTLDIEVPIKINPFFSISPYYRFYGQTAVYYFAPYKQHKPTDVFYTSDYDLSAFTSNFFGGGIRLMPEKGVFGIAHWTMLEIRYGHYIRSNSLHSDIVSLNARFK